MTQTTTEEINMVSREKMEHQEMMWIAARKTNNWRLPKPAPLFFRLPIIRNFRAFYHATQIENHNFVFGSLGMCRSGYAEMDKAWDREIAKLKEKYPPDGVKPKCDHEWNNGGMNPTHCLKCGMSLMSHAFMECP